LALIEAIKHFSVLKNDGGDLKLAKQLYALSIDSYGDFVAMQGV